MPLSSADCISRAVEMEKKAEAAPFARDSYLAMAMHWRDLARQAHFIEQRTFGYQTSVPGADS